LLQLLRIFICLSRSVIGKISSFLIQSLRCIAVFK
jgi:hypothetical protein